MWKQNWDFSKHIAAIGVSSHLAADNERPPLTPSQPVSAAGRRLVPLPWARNPPFLNQLYGGIDEPELKSMDVLICKLRKKLARATGGSHYIEAVWGRGYMLRDPAPRPGNVMQNRGREDAAAWHDASAK